MVVALRLSLEGLLKIYFELDSFPETNKSAVGVDKDMI